MAIFLAAKTFYDDICLIDEKLREYVSSMESHPPKDMSLLYWIYPYTTIFLMRDVNVKSFNEKYSFPDGTLSVMNSFPVAYMLSTNREEKCGLFDLFKYCSGDIDAVVDIPIECGSCYFPHKNQLRPFLWPCNISDEEDGAVFLLGYNKSMDDSKIAKQSPKSIRSLIK